LTDDVNSIDLDNYSLQPLKGQFEYTELYTYVNTLEKKKLRKLAISHNNWISRLDRFWKDNEEELFQSEVKSTDV